MLPPSKVQKATVLGSLPHFMGDAPLPEGGIVVDVVVVVFAAVVEVVVAGARVVDVVGTVVAGCVVVGRVVVVETVTADGSKAPIAGGLGRTAPVMSKAGAYAGFPAPAAGEFAGMRRNRVSLGFVLRKSGSAPRSFFPRVRPLAVP